MIPLKVARRYARALADVVWPRGEYGVVQQELQTWADLLRETPSLREVFAHPVIDRPRKERLLETLIERMKPHSTTAHFLRVILRHGRLHDLETIVRAFSQEIDARLGIIHVTVCSAHPLTDAETEALRQQLERTMGKTVRLHLTINDQLISGVQLRLGSEIYDGSVQARLEAIRRQLLASA